jgi:hypothetical protein
MELNGFVPIHIPFSVTESFRQLVGSSDWGTTRLKATQPSTVQANAKAADIRVVIMIVEFHTKDHTTLSPISPYLVTALNNVYFSAVFSLDVSW